MERGDTAMAFVQSFDLSPAFPEGTRCLLSIKNPFHAFPFCKCSLKKADIQKCVKFDVGNNTNNEQ